MFWVEIRYKALEIHRRGWNQTNLGTEALTTSQVEKPLPHCIRTGFVPQLKQTGQHFSRTEALTVDTTRNLDHSRRRNTLGKTHKETESRSFHINKNTKASQLSAVLDTRDRCSEIHLYT
uniref:Uncharacterized protein n=1 Tax=Opuntia streptacantha TaxID=393608 RepID=A0A7C9DN08_OPUST